ncbi:SdpI family protein [Actinomyces bowdenii]|uniref:SdpI family protein n=1 Tax=Actinomyces bowdenii TaxID=131109 RepID=A0A853EIA3_9ACTO|nr:SdpI family protein [Actinomyces bowdenii]MBF0696940.1 SdpI family protein [Actinomyces bowdenii]NYS69113.1 SdpI family protein [Actinomyces bowdenii]
MLWFTSFSLLIGGASILGMSFKVRQMKLRRNSYFGIRTKATMRSEGAFLHSNQAVWWGYAIQGLLLLISGIFLAIFLALGMGEAVPLLVILASAVVCLSVAFVQVIVANRKAMSMID